MLDRIDSLLFLAPFAYALFTLLWEAIDITIITIFISALKIIFLLGFLILIHESGHLLVAKNYAK